MLTREENAPVRAQEGGAHLKPLPRAVKGIRSADARFLLPWHVLDIFAPGGFFVLQSSRIHKGLQALQSLPHVVADPFRHVFIRLIGEVLCLVPNGIAAKYSVGAFLTERALEDVIGGAIGEEGESALGVCDGLFP